MFNKLQIVAIFVAIPLVLVYMYTSSRGISFRDIFPPGTPVMQIGEIPVRVEILDSDEERVLGLSGRDALDEVDGLLFIFPEPEYHSIWMKDMNFPIDIIWIGEDLKVISIDKNVSPASYPKVFRPARPALYAVETNIHYSDTYGIRAGLDVRLPIEFLSPK